jgi:hypothetical protein
MADCEEKTQAKRRLMTEADLVIEGDEEERLIRVQEHENGSIYVDGYSRDSDS